MRLFTDHIAYLTEPAKARPPWTPLSRLPLIIVMGLTGVGKSTVTDGVQKKQVFTLLPNRRQITDSIIIAGLQQVDGEPVSLVTDRLKRLEYTARYRAKHPGGMAYALRQLVVNGERVTLPILFDGLRGLEEAQGGLQYFPEARFLVLDAPDTVRLKRLLNRGDRFDLAQLESRPATESLIEALRLIPNLETVFSDHDLIELSQTLADLPVDEVVQKAAIIIKERHNYDSQAAKAYLLSRLSPEQLLVIDTSQWGPGAIADQVAAWLRH